MPQRNGDKLWQWITRLCAVAGFIALLLVQGLDAPTSFYVLLIGLFFGPEIITGKIKMFVKKDDEQ